MAGNVPASFSFPCRTPHQSAAGGTASGKDGAVTGGRDGGLPPRGRRDQSAPHAASTPRKVCPHRWGQRTGVPHLWPGHGAASRRGGGGYPPQCGPPPGTVRSRETGWESGGRMRTFLSRFGPPDLPFAPPYASPRGPSDIWFFCCGGERGYAAGGGCRVSGGHARISCPLPAPRGQEEHPGRFGRRGAWARQGKSSRGQRGIGAAAARAGFSGCLFRRSVRCARGNRGVDGPVPSPGVRGRPAGRGKGLRRFVRRW